MRHDERFALGPIDLEVARHEVVGLVGQSGAGKSTIVDLLSRLRRPSSGTLLVNGHDAMGYSSASWAARIACVSQEAVLLGGTVADNIRWFRDLDDEQLLAAAKQANIADEIDSLASAASTQRSGTVAPSSRSVSGSASVWRVPSPPSPTSCCSTRQPVRSTTPARNESGRRSRR